MVVWSHSSADPSVADTTYFGIALSRSAIGPVWSRHARARPCQVSCASSSASAASARSSAPCRPASVMYGKSASAGGASMTPSSVACVCAVIEVIRVRPPAGAQLIATHETGARARLHARPGAPDSKDPSPVAVASDETQQPERRRPAEGSVCGTACEAAELLVLQVKLRVHAHLGDPDPHAHAWDTEDIALPSRPVIGGLARQPHDRDLAIGLLLVLAVASRDRRYARQRVGALLPLQRLAGDLEPLRPDLEPDVVGVLRHVEKPGRVARGTAERGDDEPGALAVLEAAERRRAHLSGLRPLRGQQHHGESHLLAELLVASGAVRPDVPPGHAPEQLRARAAGDEPRAAAGASGCHANRHGPSPRIASSEVDHAAAAIAAAPGVPAHRWAAGPAQGGTAAREKSEGAARAPNGAND